MNRTLGPPTVAAPWVGRQWSYRQPLPRATRDGGGAVADYLTAIGLEVHARSIKAYSLRLETVAAEASKIGGSRSDPQSSRWTLAESPSNSPRSALRSSRAGPASNIVLVSTIQFMPKRVPSLLHLDTIPLSKCTRKCALSATVNHAVSLAKQPGIRRRRACSRRRGTAAAPSILKTELLIGS